MKFKYSGYDNAARKISGKIEALNSQEAIEKLRAQRIRPQKLVALEGGAGSGSSGSKLFSGEKPNLVEFTAFIRQMAVMQGAGMPLVQSLDILSRDSANKKFGAIVGKIKAKIEGGSTFAAALKAYPHIFDKIFTNLVQAGEVSGALENVLNRLAIYYEKSLALQRKVKGAMMYPLMILFSMGMVLVGMFGFIIPRFKDVYKSFGKELPPLTQMLLDLSGLFTEYWYVFIGGIILLAFLCRQLMITPSTRKSLDSYFIKLPLFGDLIVKNAVARFSRTLGTMLQSGVPMLEGISVTSAVLGNYTIEAAVKRAHKSIKEGSSISRPLERSKIFPGMAISMISVGEQTGSLDNMLTKVAEFYEDEVEYKVTSMTTLIEPIMIIMVGTVVLGILIALYLPMFSIGDVVG